MPEFDVLLDVLDGVLWYRRRGAGGAAGPWKRMEPVHHPIKIYRTANPGFEFTDVDPHVPALAAKPPDATRLEEM